MTSPPDPVSSGGRSSSVCPGAGLGIVFIAAFGRWDLCRGARPISPPRGRHDAAGIRVAGSLRDTDDTDDFMLITPPRPSTYSIYLCGESCAEVLEDETLFIAIYDQQGVMLAGTEIGKYAEQRVYLELDAGLPYYVGLHLLQSGGLARDYELLILE